MTMLYNGKQIMEIREALGMTRTQFAASLDVSEGAVWRWEKDERHPRFDTLVRINELVKKKGLTLATV